ncbi:hypothetical protein NAEGRDRAFT_78219 [Naegleria gruberi]|uniref:Uncharacterized protein n=1 Tax=Naegleria gruberi TaxID=5762 RepID=D2V1A4_NAEGR|nr:uncharacterized protein NAEGRDRAFT_78219 [Naegleria gruberi]EFC49434.1 hypothetical protein NAEGRDRAFT_78219 [Naegleria gruberi]|eukprot:XP_002682178.1 hypothetical protein NAEGRDRAFT_78219 [Naegleria gruberi strain NEG-M]
MTGSLRSNPSSQASSSSVMNSHHNQHQIKHTNHQQQHRNDWETLKNWTHLVMNQTVIYKDRVRDWKEDFCKSSNISCNSIDLLVYYLFIFILVFILKAIIVKLFKKFIVPFLEIKQHSDLTLEKEIEQLEKKHIPKAGKSCVIIGGSISGLLSGCVLSHHFDQVYIVEQKEMVPGHTMVAHGHQTHILLMKCIQLLDKLLTKNEKSFTESMVEEGAFELSIDMADYRTNGKPRVPLNLLNFPNMIMMSRTFLESWLRDYVKNLKNIIVLEKTEVKDILWERYHEEHFSSYDSITKKIFSATYSEIPDHNTISDTSSSSSQQQSNSPTYLGNIVHRAVGVQISGENKFDAIGGHPSIDGKTSTLDASLVIDCSGVYTKTPEWILNEVAEIDHRAKPMKKTKKKSQITNVMAIFKIKPECLSEGFYMREKKPQWLTVYSNEFPKTERVMVYRIENNLAMFIVSKLGTFEKAKNLKSKDAVLQFIKQEIPSAFKVCEECFTKFVGEGEPPVMDWSIYRRDYVLFNHWDTLPSLTNKRGKKSIVEGFLALGDAVASLNPYYGRGIALVCESCLALHESLVASRLEKKKNRQKHVHPLPYTFNFTFSRNLQLVFHYTYSYVWFVDYLAEAVFRPQNISNLFTRYVISPLLKYFISHSLEACETDSYVFLNNIRFQNMLLNWKTLFLDFKYLWHVIFPSVHSQTTLVPP